MLRKNFLLARRAEILRTIQTYFTCERNVLNFKGHTGLNITVNRNTTLARKRNLEVIDFLRSNPHLFPKWVKWVIPLKMPVQYSSDRTERSKKLIFFCWIRGKNMRPAKLLTCFLKWPKKTYKIIADSLIQIPTV